MPIVANHIAALTPYPPGKPIEELERELGITGSIKLASNENPLGPSPKALDAIRAALGKLHRYPDGSAYYLRHKLAAKLGVSPANIVFGNGSNEIIDLVIRTFLSPGQAAVICEPTFLMYGKFLAAAGCQCRKVGLTPDLRIDLEAMLRAGQAGEPARLYIVNNPNNPTGTVISRSEFDAFLAALPEGALVLLDEAYIEFAGGADTPRGLDYLAEGRVMAARTFSKMYGLAGVRLGYGLMPEALSSYIERVRQPFNVNSLAQAAALGALDDDEHFRRTLKLTAQGLEQLRSGIARLGFECLPTHANFFLVRAGDGQALYERLLREGVIIRAMGSYGLPEFVRISVGLPEENERLLSTLARVVGQA